MSNPADVFSAAFGPESGVRYRLSRSIAELFPGKSIIEGLSGAFDLDEYAGAGFCEARPRAGIHAEVVEEWARSHGLHKRTVTSIVDVTWESHSLAVACAQWAEGFHTIRRCWVIADDRETAQRFAEVLSAYCNEPHDAVMLFDGKCWSKSPGLWREIQASSFDDLVLAGEMNSEIREDFGSFLAAREEYARYGVPWKRGVLFVGPPGNGKTHCLRATIRFLGVPCLYVQSLKSRYEPDDANIAQVFARAREVSPCCLVFEDLDAMLTPENRSVFLNQLDGFANASGILTLATTNHPERLDLSIMERPSRFDRKYHFEPPGPVARARYIAAWNARLDPAMHVSPAEQRELADGTDGFSFAYLKELFLSSMLRWVKTREPGAMGGVLRAQLRALRDQMTSGQAYERKMGVADAAIDWLMARPEPAMLVRALNRSRR